MELPRIGGEIPLPTPGRPGGPRYVKGRLIPEHVLPQLPVSGGLSDLKLPEAGVPAPVVQTAPGANVGLAPGL
ncbi:hypothetical protein [Streptomyces sp. MAI_2237]